MTTKINHHGGQQPSPTLLWILDWFRSLLCDEKLTHIPRDLVNPNRAEVPTMRKGTVYPESTEKPTDKKDMVQSVRFRNEAMQGTTTFCMAWIWKLD